MQTKFISGNLKRIRISRGLTMEEAAKAAGISRMAYHNIEKGKAKPRVNNLGNLAKALNVKIFDIVRPVPKIRSVRFRALKWKSLKAMNQREEIINDLALWIKDFNDLEQLLERKKIPTFNINISRSKYKKNYAVKVAEKARDYLQLEKDEAIADICSLIESAGIKLHFITVKLDNFFGISINDEKLGAAIIVNNYAAKTTERRIFTIAHELGHILMHPESFNKESEENKSQEKEADIFASHFLMPQKAFLKKLEEVKGLDFVDAVLHMKRVFKVSYKTVLYRLVEEDIVNQEAWRIFNISYKNKHGASLNNHKEPEPLTRIDCIEDRLNRLVRDAYEKELITQSRAAEILSISIAEMRKLANSWMVIG